MYKTFGKSARPLVVRHNFDKTVRKMWLSDMQKIGVAFCAGGGLFLTLGVLMFFDRSLLAMGNVRMNTQCFYVYADLSRSCSLSASP